MTAKLRIAIFGCGTVGGTLLRLIGEKQQQLRQNSNVDLQVVAVVSGNRGSLPENFHHTYLPIANGEQVFHNPEIDVVVELIGGCTDAYRIAKHALLAKKHLVTANKALLAEHSGKLLPLAKRQHRCIMFEASCGGGIPLISVLQQGLLANQLQSFTAVLNGTCNFILTEMSSGIGFQEAIAQAQQLGFAEADPSLDLSGQDSAHKLAILGELFFNRHIPYRNIPVAGLTPQLGAALSEQQALFAQNGYVVRMVANANWQQQQLAAYVSPALVSKNCYLGQINGVDNGMMIKSDLLGSSFFAGPGAGGKETASAVLADLLSLGQGIAQPVWRGARLPGNSMATAELIAAEQLCHPQVSIVECIPQQRLPRAEVPYQEGKPWRNWRLLFWSDVARNIIDNYASNCREGGYCQSFYSLPLIANNDDR